ncbi:hypothetical protein EVAR_47714_1 [Eumeta japonica]|uniref:Uncharacterized protein n=1 Tax=Eumeta variegata TaxID=151549 RepID=A0A4C1VUK5_EUMVA|nr:hypothetical protein EVAR_47714_1 [Eumeta japonica]
MIYPPSSAPLIIIYRKLESISESRAIAQLETRGQGRMKTVKSKLKSKTGSNSINDSKITRCYMSTATQCGTGAANDRRHNRYGNIRNVHTALSGSEPTPSIADPPSLLKALQDEKLPARPPAPPQQGQDRPPSALARTPITAITDSEPRFLHTSLNFGAHKGNYPCSTTALLKHPLPRSFHFNLRDLEVKRFTMASPAPDPQLGAANDLCGRCVDDGASGLINLVASSQ